MAAFIGSITFTYPLKWITKDAPVVLGSTTRTRSGNLVILTPALQSQDFLNAKLIFEWEPYSTVTTLYSYWTTGLSYSADFEDSGSTVSVMFNPEDGVTNVKHQAWGDDVVKAEIANYPIDLYTGELNLIIVPNS